MNHIICLGPNKKSREKYVPEVVISAPELVLSEQVFLREKSLEMLTDFETQSNQIKK